MAHHSIHRIASSVRQKTSASFKSAFSCGYPSLSPTASQRWFRHRWSSSVSSETEVRRLSNKDVTPATSDEKRIAQGDKWVDERDSAEGSDSSEESDGYVTADDEAFEVEESESETSCGGSRDEGQIENGNDANTKSLASLNGGDNHLQHGRVGSEAEGRQKVPQQLNELRSMANSQERLKKVDDATLMRFLIARDMDVAKASEMFIKDWKWRDDFVPQGYITEDSISRQLQAEKAFLQGLDKHGRPLLVIVGSKHFSKGRDMEEFKRFCFYCIEKVIASMPPGKDKFVTIFDVGGTGYKNLDTSATLMIVDFLQAHYPERMGRVFVLHLPAMFQGVYKLVEPAIDAKTRKKIMFVNDAEMEVVLRREIGDDCLPKIYGGQAELIPVQYALVDTASFPSRARRSQ